MHWGDVILLFFCKQENTAIDLLNWIVQKQLKDQWTEANVKGLFKIKIIIKAESNQKCLRVIARLQAKVLSRLKKGFLLN